MALLNGVLPVNPLLPVNVYSKLPFVGMRGAQACTLMEYLLTILVKDRGYIFEHDSTLILNRDLTFGDDSFSKVYNILYNNELSYHNFNAYLLSNDSQYTIYAYTPSQRHTYYINELVAIKWTIYTITKVMYVPLGFFILLSGKVEDIKIMMNILLSIVKRHDLNMYSGFYLFFKEIEKMTRDILVMPRRIPYPADAFNYLYRISGL